MKDKYFYTVTVQFTYTDEETGKTKKNKEMYLVHAVSITDAEASVVDDLKDCTLDYRIQNVSESKITKVINLEN
jgi:hypothetical protein